MEAMVTIRSRGELLCRSDEHLDADSDRLALRAERRSEVCSVASQK